MTATHPLCGSDRLELTERGSHACKHPETIFSHPEAQSALDRGLLLELLNFVRTTGFLKHRVTLDELSEKAAPRRPATPQSRRAHVLWLLKYGLLRACS